MGDGYQGRFACHTSAWERTRKCQNNQARLLSTLMRMTVVVEMTMGVILVRYWFYILSWRRWVVFVGILVKNDSVMMVMERQTRLRKKFLWTATLVQERLEKKVISVL